jgi:hypothetical protein
VPGKIQNTTDTDIIETNDGPGNGATPESFREAAAALVRAGKDRNEVLIRLWQQNERAGKALSEDDMVQLVAEVSPDPKEAARNVTQEQQETHDGQESHRSPAKLIETDRGAIGPRKKKTGQAAQVQKEAATFRVELAIGGPSSLPFPVFLREAINEHHRAATARAGGWQSALFYFVRLVKAHPDMLGHDASQGLQLVEQVMRELWPVPKGSCCGWCHWLAVACEDAKVEFLDVWNKIRFLPGYWPLMNACEQAKRTPLKLPEDKLARRTPGYALFISIAGWLQVSMGARPIMLPVREMADWLGVQPMTISRYRWWAVEDGFLEQVRPHEFHGEGQRANKATEFVFDVFLFPALRQRAQQGG